MNASYLRYLLAALVFNTGVLAVSMSIYLSSNREGFSNNLFLYFDAVHYLNIRDNGYESSYESAFFPLFPFFWKALGLSAFGISVINGVLYTCTVSVVGRILQLKWHQFFTILALPSAVFFFIPYSEAVYYICGLILFIGLWSNNLPVQLLGLALSCFARPTLPVILGAYVLFQLTSGRRTEAIYGIVVATLGTFAAFTVHWLYTDNLFSYFSAFKTWDYNFKFPLLPFRSHGGNAIKQYDSYALLLGILSIVMAVRVLIGTVKLKRESTFGLFYIAGFTLLILGLLRGGDVSSLNRFLFCSPFFVVSILTLEKKLILSQGWRSFIMLWVAFVAFSLLFSSFVHIQTFLRYSAGALILAAYLSLGDWRPFGIKITSIVFIAVLTCVQIFMFIRFFRGEWVG